MNVELNKFIKLIVFVFFFNWLTLFVHAKFIYKNDNDLLKNKQTFVWLALKDENFVIRKLSHAQVLFEGLEINLKSLQRFYSHYNSDIFVFQPNAAQTTSLPPFESCFNSALFKLTLKKSKANHLLNKKTNIVNIYQSFSNKVFAQQNDLNKTTKASLEEKNRIDDEINELKKLFEKKNVEKNYDCVSYGYADSSNFLFRSFDMNSNETQSIEKDHSISIKTYLSIEYDKVSTINDLKPNKNISSIKNFLKNKFSYYFQNTFKDIHSNTNGLNLPENEQVFSTSSNHILTSTSIPPTTLEVKKGVVLLICNEVYEGLDFFKENYDYIFFKFHHKCCCPDACREDSTSTLLNKVLSLSENLSPSTEESHRNNGKYIDSASLLSNLFDRFNGTSQTWQAKNDQETFEKIKSFFQNLYKNNTQKSSPPYFPNHVSNEDRMRTTQHFKQQFQSQNGILFENKNKSHNSTELNAHHLPSHVWIVVLVNVIIVLSAVCIAACCCSSRGLSYTTAPYSALPKAQSHHYSLYSSCNTVYKLQASKDVPIFYEKHANSRICHVGQSVKNSEPKVSKKPPQKLKDDIPKFFIPENQLNIKLKLGEYGVCHMAMCRGVSVVAEKLNVHQNRRPLERLSSLQQTLSRLIEVSNKNLVKIHGVSVCPDAVYLVEDFVDGTSFKSIILDDRYFVDWSRKIKMLLGVSEGMSYLHNKNLNHLNLKYSNVFVDRKGVVKISGYGVKEVIHILRSNCIKGKRCHCDQNIESIKHDVRWMAPEVLRWFDKIIPSSKQSIQSLHVSSPQLIKKNIPKKCASTGWLNHKPVYASCGVLKSGNREQSNFSFTKIGMLLKNVVNASKSTFPGSLRRKKALEEEICTEVNDVNSAKFSEDWSLKSSVCKSVAESETYLDIGCWSDVHSFGMLMWWLAVAKEPYNEEEDEEEVSRLVMEGYRPGFVNSGSSTSISTPTSVNNTEPVSPFPSERYKTLMDSCWSFEPANRPSFKQVVLTLSNILQEENTKKKKKSYDVDNATNILLKSAFNIL